MIKAIYANLVVKDLDKSKEFFEKIGFKFNPNFTNDQAAGMEISENIFAMLHTKESISRFTKKSVLNSKTSTEVLLALQVESREEVDAMMTQVLAAGGREQRDPEDYSFMYARAFEDLDHHIWEVFYFIAENKAQ